MGRRPLVVMVLGWSALVLAVAAITFVVVGNAGRGVGRASAAEWVVAATSSAPTARTPTSAITPRTSSTARTMPGSESDPGAGSGSGSTSAGPAPRTRPTSTGPGTTREPATDTRRPAPGQTAPETDRKTASFTTEGGTVVASCQGAQISLDSIRPRDGWRFEKESEHGGLEVVFKAPEREVEIMLSCVAGVPTRANS